MRSGTLLIYLLLLLNHCVFGQEVEPRAYAALPKNANVFAVVYGYSNGNIISDAAQPIQDAKLNSHNIGIGYVHTFGFFKKLARIQLTQPITFMHGEGDYLGEYTTISRSGFGDTRIRFGINLTGSPALPAKDFSNYRQKAILGFSFVTSIPTGQYFEDKLFNIGTNRWGFKPEVGISKRFERVYAEAYTGVWFYTENKEYLSVKTQKQEPVLSVQAHLSYYLKNHMWFGVNGNWFTGGETLVDGVATGTLQNNWRVGATFSSPIDKKQSLKFQFHVGAFSNTGFKYNLFSLAYQYAAF